MTDFIIKIKTNGNRKRIIKYWESNYGRIPGLRSKIQKMSRFIVCNKNISNY